MAFDRQNNETKVYNTIHKQPIFPLETHIKGSSPNICASLRFEIGWRSIFKFLSTMHSNVFEINYYRVTKNCCIYFNYYHLENFQLKFIIRYETIFNSILLIGIWNIRKWIMIQYIWLIT